MKNIWIGLAAGAFFALLYGAGVLGPLDERIYDVFLRGRPERERIGNVVFLDVDDAAIAHNGVYPWPRSIMADGFLRLKEYGASAVVLDIEFVDNAPQGVDSIYFERDFPADFEETFSEISHNVTNLLEAVRSGRFSRAEEREYEKELIQRIQEEKAGLFERTSAIARDNDIYLAQASALLGRTWATINLQTQPLSGEQAERRPLAEQKFAYHPVRAAPEAQGGRYVDLLPAIPSFSQTLRGAGFTNINIDADGVRRRIFLAQEVAGFWYLQLALAPLMEYLGHPEIHLEKQRLTLKNARFPGAEVRDIVIPLDTQGRMMLDWPKTDYLNSFTPHYSFSEFSRLDDLEALMEQYAASLEADPVGFFVQFDESLSPLAAIAYQGSSLFQQSRDALGRALAEQSDEEFNRYLALRNEAVALQQSLLGLEAAAKIRTLAAALEQEYPDDAEAIRSEAEYIAQIVDYMETAAGNYAGIQEELRESFTGKFCIIGRTDTGTTDIGVTPFYSEYVNVGTHGVVLDTILRESFLVPLHPLWSAILCIVLALALVFLLSLGQDQDRNQDPNRPKQNHILQENHILRISLGLGGAFFFGVLCFIIFRYTGVFIGPLGPVLAAFTAVMIRELASYLDSEKKRQFLKIAFSAYLSPNLVKKLVDNPSQLHLGGIKLPMSAVFTDIQGFSTISEQLEPDELVGLLNRYHERMSDIIMDNMGTIDKYVGDAIVAFFGAPIEREDHAVLACRSVVMMKKAEKELNRELVKEKLIIEKVLPALKKRGLAFASDNSMPFFTRIGINTGDMVVGNMGTPKKMNYTIMGNAVNIASRLEGVNKHYHTRGILIGEDTKKAKGIEEEFIYRSLGQAQVVGINAPVRIYELLDFRDEASPAELKSLADWEKALALYVKRQFQEAEEIFSSIAAGGKKDGTAQFYVEKCRHYITNPPSKSWKGVEILTDKN
jgi:adenylate cyclase